MSKALVGYTGFVGSNLDRQMDFTHRYNSKNIHEIDDLEFDLLICAGVQGVKWLANREPGNDKRQIELLLEHLKTVKTSKFILISTIDVYPEPVDVDETTPIDISHCLPYGKHRLELERVVSDMFNTLIVRLPGLFGEGLKKNIIYDFLNQNNIEQINPEGEYQFYYLDHLARDISAALEHDIRILNITSEPVAVSDVAEICLGYSFKNPATNAPTPKYNYKSIHADKFGGRNGYMYSKQEVLGDLKNYVGKLRTLK